MVFWGGVAVANGSPVTGRNIATATSGADLPSFLEYGLVCDYYCSSYYKAVGTREEPSALTQGVPVTVFPGSIRLGIEPAIMAIP
jgi:hypothetical protein